MSFSDYQSKPEVAMICFSNLPGTFSTKASHCSLSINTTTVISDHSVLLQQSRSFVFSYYYLWGLGFWCFFVCFGLAFFSQ